jgi:CBS domain-containing protein
MSRYFNDFDDDREFHGSQEVRGRQDRFAREQPWNYGRPYSGGRLENDYGRQDFSQGRFGERAGYESDEPRYSDYGGQYAREDYRRPTYEGRERNYRPRGDRTDYQPQGRYEDRVSRSRLRVRDIMTRELAVATRDTPLHDVAVMMKQEDTGVIPVVEYRPRGGNGTTEVEDRRLNAANYTHGKLLGLITDRDLTLRAIAEGKDCSTTLAGEVMSGDPHTAKPHERVVDVIRKMGDKQVRRIPVVNDNGNLLGIVSMGDIAVETEADRELADALEDISRESSFWGKLFR